MTVALVTTAVVAGPDQCFVLSMTQENHPCGEETAKSDAISIHRLEGNTIDRTTATSDNGLFGQFVWAALNRLCRDRIRVQKISIDKPS